ncbi:MAG: hypothetical protein ACYDC1_08965 [Limisphaerales bacterium]
MKPLPPLAVFWSAVIVASAAALAGDVAPATVGSSPYAKWTRGPEPDAGYFPIAVWLQSPARATRYREAGFNTFVGLWNGPTDAQLDTLKQAGMKVICELNDVARKRLDDPTLIGWMHGDEPDNAQARQGGGYGPPIPPADIIRDYERLRQIDPSRPILLNLGQGVAWDGWHGRGVRTNHPEDYPEYLRGGDIVSFDIYPVTHDRAPVAGQLGYVGRGVERLVRWGEGRKIIWNCIECTRIQHPTAKPTPPQVRSEVWMSLIHGSRGLIYFVHEWQPRFNEAALLDDREMLAAVTKLNRQITTLAPVLNGPDVTGAVEIQSDNSAVPVVTLVKASGADLFVFAVAMGDKAAGANFRLTHPTRAYRTIEVLEESRELAIEAGTFRDTFEPWGVHLYRLRAGNP